MSSELSSYEAAIRDLESERQEIDMLIEGLRRRIAKAVAGNGTAVGVFSATSSNIPDDAFFAMPIADAAKKYLSLVKQTKTTAEIAEALLRGGLKSSAADLPSTVRAIIGQREDFMRVNGKWGLALWYPGAKRSKQAKEDPEPVKPKPKATKKTGIIIDSIKAEAAPSATKNNVPLVLKFLTDNSGSHAVQDIAKAIGASHVASLRSLLSVMCKRGDIQKGTPSGYQIVSAK
jgi:hypothetical protein